MTLTHLSFSSVVWFSRANVHPWLTLPSQSIVVPDCPLNRSWFLIALPAVAANGVALK
jgi:hypothetical protein